jgi:putative hydrolase of the HAD superfamily
VAREPRARSETEEALLALDRGGSGPRAAFFGALGAKLGAAATAVKKRFQRELPAHVAPCPEVARWLAAFRGRKIVVTNGSKQLQRAKLDAAGLSQHVDALLTSEEHGAAKPQPSIFRSGLALAGAAADDALMIGDHPQNDVFGASRVGIPACFVRTRWFEVPAGVRSVSSVCEVAL